MLMSTARRCGSIFSAAKQVPRTLEQCCLDAVVVAASVSTPQRRAPVVRRASTYKSSSRASSEADSSSTTKRKGGGSYSPLPLAYVSYERRDTTASAVAPAPSKTPLVIHHSLFGCKENWKKTAKEVNSISRRPAFAIDGRNHGESPHSSEMSLALMAKDVVHFARRLSMEKISFVGHSFGGMIGMAVALVCPQMLSKLVVVDATAALRDDDSSLRRRHSLILKATAVLKNMEPELRQRQGYSRVSAASKAVEPILKDKRDIAVVLSNLVVTGGASPEAAERQPGTETNDGVKSDPNSLWRVNLDSILSNPGLMDFPDFDESVAFEGPALFIQGRNSQCRDDEDKVRRLFPNAEFVWMGDCGHWIHLEKHEEFLQHVLQFLDRKQ